MTSSQASAGVDRQEFPGGLIYHLALRADWQDALERGDDYRRSMLGRDLSEEGFLHCSFASQVGKIAELVYRGRADVLLLSIDTSRVKSPLREQRTPTAARTSSRISTGRCRSTQSSTPHRSL